MTRISIACYRPNPGKDDEVLALVQAHVPLLRRLELAEEEPYVLMKAGDGTILELFAWKSRDTKTAAHQSPEVMELWGKMEACCRNVPLTSLEEAQAQFAGFEPL